MSWSRSRRWPALACAVTLIVAACADTTTTPSPDDSPSAPPATAVPSAGPFEPLAWPASDVDCDAQTYDGAPYSGSIRRITATDARTVVFELCAPDVAFLARVASPALAINDTGWIEQMIAADDAAEQAIVSRVNGTGAYRLESWDRGAQLSMRANPDHWAGTPATELLVFLWSSVADQRLLEIRQGTVDGIDGLDPSGIEGVRADPDLQVKEREGTTTTYLGFNNTLEPFDNEKVRQAIAMGIDRQRIADTFYAGSTAASHFAPCSITFGCVGEAWYEFNPSQARALLAEAGAADGFATTIRYPAAARPSFPNPAGVAADIADQLATNLGIEVLVQAMDPEEFQASASSGTLDGIHLAEWTSAVPDMTAFMDPLFTRGATPQLGDPWDDLSAALGQGAAVADPAVREASYVTANDALRAHVPLVPLAHVGSAAAFRVDVGGNVHVSPLGVEQFAGMDPGRPQMVWMQASEPDGLYCADESARDAFRVCSQMQDSLYRPAIAGTSPEPALAERCEPSEDLATWTCTLRDGVTFHDGAALDANDVVLSFVVQWDATHPLHRGRTGTFPTFALLFGGFLGTPGG